MFRSFCITGAIDFKAAANLERLPDISNKIMHGKGAVLVLQ